MLTASEKAAIDRYWAGYFGCVSTDLYKPATLVIEHAALDDYQGIFVFNHPPACIVSTSPAIRDRVERMVGEYSPGSVCDRALLEQHFAPVLARCVGPAWLGYAGSDDFRGATLQGTRLLALGDDQALRELAASCEPEAWEHSGLELDRPPIFGHYVGDDIVAAAGYEIWGGTIAHIGVVTRPTHRGHGFGKSVVSAAADFALTQRLIAQYRTLESNTHSIAIGKALGFQAYARTIAVRLTSIQP